MVRHNNVIPNGHFHKKWQNYVKTWFDQPGRKLRRRQARSAKALKVAPRPVEGLFRPAVRCQTVKYNRRLRVGRGFTLEELKEAGIRRKEARTIGIAVDHRRRNHSVESLQLNVLRLKAYKSRLVVFPKVAKKPKKGDSQPADLQNIKQLEGPILPVTQINPRLKARKITDEERKKSVYSTLRYARSKLRLQGKRAKRAAAKAANEVNKKPSAE